MFFSCSLKYKKLTSVCATTTLDEPQVGRSIIGLVIHKFTKSLGAKYSVRISFFTSFEVGLNLCI